MPLLIFDERLDPTDESILPNVEDSGDKQKRKRQIRVFHNCWIPGCDDEAKYL